MGYDLHITRAPNSAYAERPIQPQVVRPWVTARLPSGVTSIPCPPVAYWTGHPSGEPVPFFFDRDHIEVARDPATLARLRELAPLLDAHALDDELKPA